MSYCLAIDIGASSGRHIVGWMEDGQFRSKEVYRFPNGVKILDGHLTWNIRKLFSNVYLELVSFLKANGAAPKMDLVELWKRIVFNMAVSNTDDHLRNHGFILTQTGWRLSPLYDVNPIPYGEYLALNVSEDDSSINFDLAIETAQYYGITRKEAEKIVNEISTTVRDNWERLANQYGLSRGNIEKMRPAFSACYR